ncbi:MAG TPA: BamA/TamA family outer membrane protein [Bryobacteraceae bacterium]|nr:BamA/TamA family outer membrane protein [Bryobacteraceae bacterium]
MPDAVRAQLRSDQIESARDEKEAHLEPEQPSRPERDFVRAQNSLPYRLLTGQVGGFGIGFGQIAPGSGFSIGPQYKRTDLLDGRLTFSAGARVAANQSYLGRLDLTLYGLPGDRGFLGFSVVHRDISEMPYYGPGPSSDKSGRSNFRLEDTNLEVSPGIQLWRNLRVGAIGSHLAVNTGPGHSSTYISAEHQYGPNVTPGIDRQSSFWRGGGFVEYDWRDRPSGTTRGGKYFARYLRYLDRDLGRYSFFRLDLDASQYVPLLNGTHVIALHGSSSLTSHNGSQTVPFYLQPTLGGSDTLRGYRFFRFYGDNSVMINAEYRWQISPLLDMAVFSDAGKVFNRWEQWNLHSLESDVGFGFRFKFRGRVALNLDTGFSHEGFQIWFRVNDLF